MEIKNVNPLGDVEDLLIGRAVVAGEVVDVSDEVAEDRIATGNYVAVEAASKKKG